MKLNNKLKKSDKAIDYSDIPELDSSFWENAKLKFPEPKKAISIRIDLDTLNWYKNRGKGYQSLMVTVLRSFKDMKDQEKTT